MHEDELDLRRLLDAAQAAADRADQVSLPHYRRGVEATVKADGSPVTVADRETEGAVREVLASRAAELPVVGEEGGGELDLRGACWVVDPIDGTKNFLRGVDAWATLIAVVADGEPVLGVVSAPALGERWVAARGLGARRNGQPVRVSGHASLDDAHVLHGGLDWFRQVEGGWDLLGRVADRVWRTRGFGDFWMHLMVADGRAEACLEGDLKPWDLAAVQCVIEEAGGRVTAWDGGSALAQGQVLATNGHVHEALLELIAAR